jgi:predicted methyltransferase
MHGVQRHSKSRSVKDRAAEMKRRAIETLNLRPGDTVADVGCGDGFYTIPLARFLGPSGMVYAEDISDPELINRPPQISGYATAYRLKR